MTVKNCPHCSAEIPPEFGVMPVCFMCGSDLNAQPTQVWAAVDIKQDNTRTCHRCQEVIASVFTMECPKCQAALQMPGQEATPEPVMASAQPERGPSRETVLDTAPPQQRVPDSTPVRRRTAPKEGFFSKFLRMLGLGR